MVFHALRKVDVKVMRGPRTLGRKQRRVFPWSRFKVAADTMERARVLEEQPGYWA